MNGKLVAVIVTFNRLDKLQFSVQQALEKDFYKLIIVDNCSTDGTKEWLATLSANNLVVIHSERNLGGAGGFELGFRHAVRQLPEADWLVCFDDDAYPASDIVVTFDQLSIPDSVGSLAAAVYLPDGRISEMNRPSRNPFWHLREFFSTALRGRHGFHVDDSSYQASVPLDIDASSFVGCFIRLSLIREGKIGFPRSELFIYADDIIYVLEARKAGFRHWFVPTISFIHDCQTLVNQQDVYHPLWKVYYTFRNRLEMYRIASGIFYPLILLVKIPKCFLTVRFYAPREKKKFLAIATRAVWDGVRRDYSRTHEQVVQFSELS